MQYFSRNLEPLQLNNNSAGSFGTLANKFAVNEKLKGLTLLVYGHLTFVITVYERPRGYHRVQQVFRLTSNLPEIVFTVSRLSCVSRKYQFGKIYFSRFLKKARKVYDIHIIQHTYARDKRTDNRVELRQSFSPLLYLHNDVLP